MLFTQEKRCICVDSLTNYTCMNLVAIAPATCSSYTSFLLQKCFHMERFGWTCGTRPQDYFNKKGMSWWQYTEIKLWYLVLKWENLHTALLKGKSLEPVFCQPINTKTSWTNIAILCQQVIIYCYSLPCQKTFSQKNKFFHIGAKLLTERVEIKTK